MPRTRGARLAIREARLITAELRRLGVPPRTIAKIWAAVIGVPVLFILVYVAVDDSGPTNKTSIQQIQAGGTSDFSAFPCEPGQKKSSIDGGKCKDVSDQVAEESHQNTPTSVKSNHTSGFTTQASTPKVFGNATVHRSEIKKRCGFDTGSMPCGYDDGKFGVIATLREGDRVKVLSPSTRAKDGEDIFKVRTAQGWEGWIDANYVTLDY